MLNREKVIGALAACARGNITCKQSRCPYWGEYDDCIGKMAKDALELLEAQESIAPIIEQDMNEYTSDIELIYFCGACHYQIYKSENYCAHCGRKIKYDEKRENYYRS